MNQRAWDYWVVVVGPVAIGLPAAIAHLHGGNWNRFILLALLASVSQLLSFQLNRRRVFHPAIVFVVAGALLLPPAYLVFLVVIHCIPDCVKQRYPWYIQSFNISNYAIAGLAAWAAAHAIGFSSGPGREAAAGVAAAVVFVLVNRALLMPMLMRARGLTVQQTGLLDVEDLTLELVLAIMAVSLAALWDRSFWLAALALSPLFVIHFTQRAVLKLEEAGAELEVAHGEVVRRSTGALEALSVTVDARDKYTAGHSRRVASMSRAIAEELGLPPAELDIVSQAALLHDIGKIGVSDAVLLKAGPLTTAEWTEMKRHPEEGARIIEPLGYLDEVVPGIRHHHERLDGRGYPDSLMADEIPLVARIIHVADAYDAMTTERPYRKALGRDHALAELRNGSGTDFCERCVSALERAFAAGTLSADVRLHAVPAA